MADKYDPVKAHNYYERHKHLKGRRAAPKSSGNRPPPMGVGSRRVDDSANSSRHITRKPAYFKAQAETQARVKRLTVAVSKLKSALSTAEAELSKKRQAASAAAKKNSDGKSTAAEKTASKQYRDKHKTELSTKEKQQRQAAGSKPKSTSSSSGSSSSSSTSSSSSSSSVSSMSTSELVTRISHIKSALREAQTQLSTAQRQLGQLAHSAITSEPSFDANFARFRSAERMPSQ